VDTVYQCTKREICTTWSNMEERYSKGRVNATALCCIENACHVSTPPLLPPHSTLPSLVYKMSLWTMLRYLPAVQTYYLSGVNIHLSTCVLYKKQFMHVQYFGLFTTKNLFSYLAKNLPIDSLKYANIS
jgi:hypothetical protein